MLFIFLFIYFCPYLHSLTLTFLSALPPTQYEGSRLNEEVSEGEEGAVCSVSFFPSLLPANKEVGFKGRATAPPLSVMAFSPCFTGKIPPTHTPTLPPRSGLCVDVSVLDALFGLCVGANVPAVLQSCLFPTFDAFSVCVRACVRA